MIVGHSYQDSMDPTRTVVPFNDKGDCRVYFDGVYCGNANIPKSLFNLDCSSDHRRGDGPGLRYGFGEPRAEGESGEADDESRYPDGDFDNGF